MASPSKFFGDIRLVIVLLLIAGFSAESEAQDNRQLSMSLNGSYRYEFIGQHFLENGRTQFVFASRKNNYDSLVVHLLNFNDELVLESTKSIIGNRHFGSVGKAELLPDGYLIFFQDLGAGDSFLFKLDTLGNINWTRSYSGNQILSRISADAATDSYYAMSYPPGSYSDEVFLMKGKLSDTTYNAARFVINANMSFRTGGAMREGNDFYVTYSSEGNGAVKGGIVAKFRDTELLWARLFQLPGDEEGNAFEPQSPIISNNGMLWIPYASNESYNGPKKVTLLEFDTLGNFNWAKRYSHPTEGIFGRLEQVNDATLIVFSQSSTFKRSYYSCDSEGNLENGRVSLFSQGFGSGGFSWFNYNQSDQNTACIGQSSSFGGLLYQVVPNPFELCEHGPGNLITTNTISPVISPITFSRTPQQYDLYDPIPFELLDTPDFVIENQCTTILGEKKLEHNSLSVFPNPGNGNFTFSGFEQHSVLQIFDFSGKRIMEKMISGSGEFEFTTDVTGVYFYHIQSGKNIFTGKLINRRTF